MQFDQHYYRRYYLDAHTAVNTRADMERLARWIAAYAKYIDLPVRRILDAGCGCGWLRTPFRRALPKAIYVGLEYSEYLCARHGWQRGSLDTYQSAIPFDLIVCNGVLQYLGDRAAARAIRNLATLGRGLLYLNALTRSDWDHRCDRQLTDGDVHIRHGDWYRTRLRRQFRELGCGLWLSPRAAAVPWELEQVSVP